MTPTLYGRWQSRIFLLATIGILVTLPFYFGWLGEAGNTHYFWVLFYVGVFGLGWDVVYNALTQLMWDHDWPGIFQWFAAIWEGIFLGAILSWFGLPFFARQDFEWGGFIRHYGLVWLCIYLSSWVVMRILFPRWRFRGGEWLGPWPHSN